MARSFAPLSVPFRFGDEGKKSMGNKIIFEPIKFGVAWHIRAVCPGNQGAEHITGFASEAAAREWIASDDAKAWLRSRDYPED
jgi:hypothetical protein